MASSHLDVNGLFVGCTGANIRAMAKRRSSSYRVSVAVNGSVTVHYNDDFLINRHCVNGSDCIDFEYDNDNLLVRSSDMSLFRDDQRRGLLSITILDQIVTQQNYNDFGELIQFEAAIGELEAELIRVIGRDFGPNGSRIDDVRERIDGYRELINQLPASRDDFEFENFISFLQESAVDIGPVGSCVGNCGGSADDCECSSDCVDFGDCCYDYVPMCAVGEPSEPTAAQMINEMKALVETVDPGGVSGEPFYTVTYKRDAIGRITEKTETIQETTTSEVYDYDLAGRLETVTCNGNKHVILMMITAIA